MDEKEFQQQLENFKNLSNPSSTFISACLEHIEFLKSKQKCGMCIDCSSFDLIDHNGEKDNILGWPYCSKTIRDVGKNFGCILFTEKKNEN